MQEALKIWKITIAILLPILGITYLLLEGNSSLLDLSSETNSSQLFSFYIIIYLIEIVISIVLFISIPTSISVAQLFDKGRAQNIIPYLITIALIYPITLIIKYCLLHIDITLLQNQKLFYLIILNVIVATSICTYLCRSILYNTPNKIQNHTYTATN